MSDKDLHACIDQFKRGDFSRREEFILAHTRMATVVALSYGFRANRADDLIGVTMFELCKFPERVYSGCMYNNEIIRYLLSRLHYACKDYISVDRIFGPSRGHVNNTGVSIKREANDSPNAMSVGHCDKSNDLYLDLKSLCKTRKDEQVLDCVFKGMYDTEIAKIFGWRSSNSVTFVMNKLIQRYREKIIEPVVIWLPCPDFKSSANCLCESDLTTQITTIKEVLLFKWTKHPMSLMWRGHHFQLCNYGLQCSQQNKNEFDWFVHQRESYCDTGLPSWFGQALVHESHRGNLLRKNADYYSKFNWKEKPTSNFYWPVLK